MGVPGNLRTVQQLVESHYVSLYRYAYRLTGSSVDAEDLTQETFCKAQQNLAQLRDPTKARSWLFCILRRNFLQRERSAKTRACVSLDWIGDLPEPTPEPLPEIDQEQLQRALQELPEAFRTPIILYYFEDFSYRDIAEQMELPIGTVMSRLARAKTFLRSRLLSGDGEIAAQGPRLRRATDGL